MNKRDNFIPLFALGTSSYYPQIARYCDNVDFIENDKIYHVKNNKHQHIVNNNNYCVKFPEIKTINDNDSYVDPVGLAIASVNKLFSKLFCKTKYYLTNTTSNYYYSVDLSKYNL